MPIKKNNKNYGTKVRIEDVPPVLTTLNVTANGTYTPTSPVEGYSSVTVNVGNIPVDYFYVEDVSGSSNTLSIKKRNASASTIEVFYSTDQQNWTSMGTTSTTAITATVPANGKLYLKATTNKWGYSGVKGNIIVCNGRFKVGGGIMSLLCGDNYANKILTNSNTSAFAGMFAYNNRITGAEDLVLPSNTIEGCYNCMFYGTENLVTPPALPATTLANNCYQQMFAYCIKMTTPPELPATALANSCYAGMFQGCTSLTQAPALPAPTLVDSCYDNMFSECTNLNSVTTYATDISARNCLYNWLNGVSSTGDFYNLGGAAYPSGTSGIPTGWTEHTSL